MPESWDLFGNLNNEQPQDLEFLKKEVGQRFPLYDLRYNKKTIAFFCRIDDAILEDKFDDLRKKLSEKGYVPLLRYERGEQIIYILRKPKSKEKPIWINFALLAATIVTTILTGSLLYMNHMDIWSLADPKDIFAAENLFFGAILFSLPLMSILIVHEMGHYFISKKHGIATSLPYFIPIPPILGFNIGTFGALISSRDPMPNKKALFDVGIAGPLAGFFVAIPITIIGILTADIVPNIALEDMPSGSVVFGTSLLIDAFSFILRDIPAGYTIDMNPILFAGWVGLLITSLNLLPAGQLDGGHIFRATLGEKQKYAGWVAIIIMIFTGWWFFAFIILFMMGSMHPPPLNDKTGLDFKRKILFIVAIGMLVFCYIPFPIHIIP